MLQIIWNIVPQGSPAVLKRCTKCGRTMPFRSSGCFRVNAQQKNLDVWLIYKCEACDSTWNMELHSRIKPTALSAELYNAYTRNDPDLALRCSFDRPLLAANGATVDFSDLSYDIQGEPIRLQELTSPVKLSLRSPFPLEIRVEQLLRQKMCLSRAAFTRLVEQGAITGCHRLDKAKLNSGADLLLSPVR